MNDMNKQMHFVLYHSDESDVSVNAVIQNDSIWVTQKAMADLFSVNTPAISKHLKNIYEEGELREESTVSKMEIVQTEGNRQVRRNVDFYNLDAIISVGYRVNSRQATKFRIWATGVLKEYMIKGFALDDERLKQGEAVFGKDYFRELLERVRSIRSSERRIWQQITDIFAECSIDYDRNSEVTKRFLKSDVTIAKNYLDEKQIRQLERAVSGYFDYIEDLIERENTFTMEEFETSVNEFLNFRRYDVLKDNGRISAKQAKEKAEAEYDVFNKTQKITSDFDREVLKMLGKNGGVSV